MICAMRSPQQALRKGYPRHDRAAITGHKSTQMMKRYTHISGKVLVDAVRVSRVFIGDLDDSKGAIDLEKEFSNALMEAITELGTSDLDAFIHEPDEISLVIDLCESPEDYWTIRVDYGEAGWSRSEAFMMVYDVMRDAGIVAILLNDAEDDETGISEDLRPDDEVRH